MANTYTLINSTSLSTTAASVTFSAIPATYDDLVIQASIRSNYSGNYDYSYVVLNNTTTGNLYSNTLLEGYASAASSARDSNLSNPSGQNTGGAINAATATSNTFANWELYIPKYTSTTSKSFSNFSVTENNASGANSADIRVLASLFRNTAAITEIKIAPQYGTNFVSGSTFWLYGIKNS